MIGDTKDELIMMLKRKLNESDEQNKSLKHDLDELRKGNTGQDAEIKAIKEIHS
jgi:predicted RNase H-like nuclease (RuvC/YqgF family)